MNLFKKVLLASTFMLAALGSSLSKPAQAQTPTPTARWAVSLTYTETSKADNLGTMRESTPLSTNYPYEPGINALAVDYPISLIQGDGTGHALANNMSFQVDFTWVGDPSDRPSSVTIIENVSAIAEVGYKPKGGKPDYNATGAIDFQASVTGFPTTYSSTSGPTYRKVIVAHTATYPVTSNVVHLPTRYASSNLVFNYGSMPASDRPGTVHSLVDYLVKVDGF